MTLRETAANDKFSTDVAKWIDEAQIQWQIPELENIYTQHKYKNMCLVLNGTTGNDGRYGYGYRYGYRYGYHYGYHNNKYGYYGHDRGGYYHEDE